VDTADSHHDDAVGSERVAYGTASIAACGSLCADGLQAGDESDLDCRGSCEPCAGLVCNDGSDCASAVCSPTATSTRECAPPRCNDGVLNGDEVDVDCGGSECPSCPS
jgi:hypothetical protein